MSGESVFAKIQPQSPGQEEVVKVLADKKYEIVGLFGPTGSGKSLFSIMYGLDSVITGRYRRFIITRPLIDVVSGREISAADLGELYYKIIQSYIEDLVSGFIEWSKVQELINRGQVVIADSHYLKGRTFDDSVILLDDAQSLPVESAIEVITRLGRNSRLIIAGDPVFQRSIGSRDSASMLRELLLGEENARIVDLGLKDIVRPGAKRGIKLLLESKMRSRQLDDIEKNVLNSARVHAPDADIVTIVNIVDLKKTYNITSEHAPDVLIIAKEGYQGRVIGKGGERVQAIEKDTEMKIRVVELTLDFKPFIRAVHPVSWIYKHVVDVDFAGPNLAVKVESSAYGAFVGQKGIHVRFIDHFFRKILDTGVRCYEVEVEEEKKTEKKTRRK
ncbi:MAG: PhoH family protein [Desulfurococcaceae archaeon]|jgi:phosphate starvation-inducible protein PhoH|nr:PhoH family protein [Desulfurococcaceae archaeon]